MENQKQLQNNNTNDLVLQNQRLSDSYFKLLEDYNTKAYMYDLQTRKLVKEIMQLRQENSMLKLRLGL